MGRDVDEMRERLEELERRLGVLRAGTATGIRKRSSRRVFGLPLYDIATGPDPESGEVRGHARGFIAVGDMATGVIAVGGFARGVVAIGGLAVGAVTLAGASVGLWLALGGLALGGVAVSGVAVGYVAVGGLAIGYYACGGLALGAQVISAMRQDPEAVQFFSQYLPWLDQLRRD